MEDRQEPAANSGGNELDAAQLLRQRAQARLPGRFLGGAELIEELSPQAMREALHELRLHQIELEMQNDELRRTRYELDAQRDRYFDLYDLAPVGYCTLSEQGLIVSANLTIAKLLDTERSALLGQCFNRFVCREQQDRYYLYVKQLLQTQESQVCELPMQTLQGHVFWVHLAAVALPAQDAGQILRVTVSDITERMHARQLLSDNMAALQLRDQALSQISEGVLTTGVDRRITYANAEFERITGYSQTEMLGQPCGILQGAEGQPELVQQMRAALNAAQPFRGEILNYRKDGTPFWNDLSIIPVFDDQGRLSQYVGVLRDVTARKQTMEELQLFKNCVAHANDVIVITEAEPFIEPGPRILFVNEAYQRTTGYTAEEALGKTPRMLQGPKTDRATLDRILASLKQWKPIREEVLNYTKDGREFWSELEIYPLADETGWYTHWISIQRDITERKQATQELIEAIQAREDAQAANYAKTQFLANISHEFRTPMNGVMGMAQLLQMPGLTEAERIDYAGVILRSGQTLMNLLNDVLDITRIEAGKLEFESVRLQPAQIIGAVQLLFSQRARDKGLALESNWIGPELPYQGDPQRLTQMLSNLVNNAIKFTAQGGIRIEAREVACTAQHATLEFAVSDTGIGIEPQKQSLLFQNFFQIDSSNTRNYDGAGLGLSMVRQLAELMGGEVGVQSQVGQGSRFWFRIQVQGLGSTG